jgi:hypothetical protein
VQYTVRWSQWKKHSFIEYINMYLLLRDGSEILQLLKVIFLAFTKYRIFLWFYFFYS